MPRTKSAATTTDPLEIPRYKQFAIYVATGMSINKARQQTGVSNDTASKLMRDQTILNYIQEVRAENEQELKISRQDVLKGQLHAIRQADIQGDPMTQINGWREIARMEGMYAPEKHEHHHSGEIKHMDEDVRSKSTNELEQMLKQNGGDIVDGEYEECQEEGGTG